MGRYQDLLNLIPRGQFYQNDGYVLPFQTAPQEFLYQDTPNTQFGVFLDNAFVTTLESDAQGDLVVRLELDPGQHQIVIENNITGRRFTSYVNIQDYATWYAAYASQLEGVIDANVLDVEKGVRLAEATSTHIEDTFGRALGQPNDLGYVTDTYRTVLQALRQAYRIFAGKVTGVYKTIAAFTNVVPFLVPRAWRPRWFLGAQFAPDSDFDDRSTALSILANLNQRAFIFVGDGLTDNVLVYTTVLNDPPSPQSLRLEFTGWGGGATLDITGTGVNGLTQTETVVTVTNGVVETSLVYASVQRIEHGSAGSGAGTLDVGLTNERFLRLVRAEGAVPPSFTLSLITENGVDYLTTGTTFNDNALQVGSKGRFALDFRSGLKRVAALNPGPYNTQGANRLYFNISDRGPFTAILTEGASVVPAALVGDINTRASTAPNYGVNIAEVESGSGLTGDYLVITSDNARRPNGSGTGPGYVRLDFGCADAAPEIFGIPRFRSATTASVAAGATSITYSTSDRLAEVLAPFELRVGRGLLSSGTTGEFANSDGIVTDFVLTGVGNDLVPGDCVEVDNPVTNATNVGLHEVIEVVNANTVRVRHGFTQRDFVNESGLTYSLWSLGDVVEVDANDTTTGTLNIATSGGIPRPLSSGAALELTDELPFLTPTDPRESEGRLILDINPALKPSSTPVSDTVTATRNDIPDGWVSNATSTEIRQEAYLSRTGTILTAPAGGVTLEGDIRNVIPDLIGFPIRVSFWVQQHNAATQDFSIDISTDGGSTYDTGSAQSVPGTRSPAGSGEGAALDPTLVTRLFTPQRNATGVRVRLSHTGSAGDRVTVERVLVTGEFSTALFLGKNTYVRDAASSNETDPVLYIWSPEDLSAAENATIGLPDSTVEPGQIDQVLPAHVRMRRFDISQYDSSGNPINVRGVYDEADWLSATVTNMDIEPGVPGRLTFARPNITSRVSDELSPSPIGTALLSTDSTFLGPYPQDPDNTVRLDADGVPQGVGVDATMSLPFVFTDANQIDINAVDLNKVYTFEYDRFIGLETPIIDLGADRGNYIWLVDSYIAQRTTNTLGEREVTQEVTFNASLQARLNIPANQNITQTTLVRDNGITEEAVPQANVSFIDRRTIQLSDADFDANSLYSFTYISLFNQFGLAPRFRIEVRSAPTASGVATAPYNEAEVNDPIDPDDQFFQLRLTLFGVEGPDDVRVHSLGLKGIQVAGAGANAPGVIE